VKIFIDGYGVVAHSILRKLLDVHNIQPDNILVNTYNIPDNQAFIDFLKRRDINFTDESYKNLSNEFSSYSVDLFFSLYGRRIIPEYILKDIRLNSINLHPSLLPEYKGCFSCPWVIINGEKKTGITFHEIDKGIDTGSILYQVELDLDGKETGYSLYHKLASEFVSRFDQFYENLLNDRHISIEMHKGGDYYPRKVPYDGIIDLNWPESKIESFIRAMYFPPFKSAILFKDDQEFEVDTFQQYQNIISF
jgi:methionyl-tRNA formyltransferase